MTVTGRTLAEDLADVPDGDREVIRSYAKPMLEAAGYVVMSGNLFDSAVMKMSVIDKDFRKRFLSDPDRPNVFEGKAIVFEGPEDYHHRIEDPDLGVEDQSVLIIRNCGPVGYPGSAEVVNMQPPAALLKRGIEPCRRWVTGGSPARRRPFDPERRHPRRRSAAAWPCCKPATASGSISTPARWTCCCRAGELEQRRAAWTPPTLDQHDAVGGNLPLHGRTARHRRLPGTGNAISRT